MNERLERAVSRAIELGRRHPLKGQQTVVTVAERNFYVLVLPLPGDPDRLDDLPEELWPTWKEEFMEWLRKGKTIKTAAELAGVTRRHVYRIRDKDLRFAQAWDEARASQT